MEDATIKRIEQKLDRILHILGDGRKDISAEAKRVIQLKLQPKIICAKNKDNVREKKG